MREGLRRAHLGEPVLAALLGGFDGDGLPLGLLLRGFFLVEADDGAIGDDGGDLGGADLDRFLDDQVHVFPFRDGLGQGDLAAERRRGALVQFAQGDVAAIERGDLGGDLAALAVEEDGFVAGLEAEDVAAVMRFGAGEEERVGVEVGGREVEAVHLEEGETSNVERPTSNASNAGISRGCVIAMQSFGLTGRILSRGRRSFCAAACFLRRRARRILRASGVARRSGGSGTSTMRRASRSPRSRPLTFMMPLSRSLKIWPLCVPAGTFRLALPSRVGTATSPPSAARVNGTGQFAIEIVFFALEDRVLLHVDDDVKIAGRAAADAGLAVARGAQARAFRDPGGNLQLDPAGLLDAAFAFAGACTVSR